MVTTESKLSPRRVQRRRSPRAHSPNKTAAGKHQANWLAPSRVIDFPQAKGKRVESIQFFSEVDANNLSIYFRDKSSLNIRVDPAFTLEAAYSEWKQGNEHVVRRWPSIRPLRSRK